MVYGVIKQSGAQSPYSELGRDVIFLPQCEINVSPIKTTAEGLEVNGTKTILVVEDQVAIREVTAFTCGSWLQRTGCARR